MGRFTRDGNHRVLATVSINLLTDLTYAAVDRRIAAEEGGRGRCEGGRSARQ